MKKNIIFYSVFFLFILFLIISYLPEDNQITNDSEINFSIFVSKDLGVKELKYPSDMYIKGTIEQAVSDKLLFYKEYIKKLNLQICVIFLVDTPLKVLLNELTFDETHLTQNW